MMRMWFGLEIDVVGLPPLIQYNNENEIIDFSIDLLTNFICEICS